MTRGNPAIAALGAKKSAERRKESEAKIAEAKERIRRRIEETGTHGPGRLTMKEFLRGTGLNLMYFEGKDKKAAKAEMKEWLARAQDGFREPEVPPAPPVIEDGLTKMRAEFVKLQNAYAAAHLEYGDRARKLAMAEERIGTLEGENHRLWEIIQGAGLDEVAGPRKRSGIRVPARSEGNGRVATQG